MHPATVCESLTLDSSQFLNTPPQQPLAMTSETALDSLSSHALAEARFKAVMAAEPQLLKKEQVSLQKPGSIAAMIYLIRDRYHPAIRRETAWIKSFWRVSCVELRFCPKFCQSLNKQPKKVIRRFDINGLAPFALFKQNPTSLGIVPTLPPSTL